ncbi:MAG TPA: anti-sigma factor [Candidatus Binatia bacterium]|nr:anti-sigma factor [Candidatus Binatia bacterium]
MSVAHEPFAELAAGYAVGALDPADAATFERHVADGCPECEAALRDYRAALVAAADALSTTPPPAARAAVLRRLGPSPRGRVGIVVGWATSVALAAGIAAVVSANWVSRGYEERLAGMERQAAALRDQIAEQVRTVSDLRRQLDEQEHALTLVRAESAEQAQTLALLGDPATSVVSLAGLDPSPAAKARLLWNTGRGGLLVTADLPPAPGGKTYELWAIAGGKPLPAGVFGVDASGRATVRVEPIAGVAAIDVFAVTLEPAGGVPAPSGPMYLASKPA